MDLTSSLKVTADVEIWKPVVGFDGFYEVSSNGKVRSVSRTDCAGRRRKAKLISAGIGPKGYRSVNLYKDRSVRGLRVSRLVLSSFVGPCPQGMEAAHNNGCRSDDRLSNLRWATHVENCADKIVHGTNVVLRGERAGSSKLSEDAVRDIFRAYKDGERQKDIAARIGIGRPQVSTILSGKSWKHLGLR